MKNVLDLYLEDGHKGIRVSGGKECQGPCPRCAGNDRFCIYPEQNQKAGEGGPRGSFHCGHGKGGNGCGAAGDNIQYLIEFHGLDFKAAAAELGILVGDNRPAESRRYRTPVLPPRPADALAVARDKGWGEEVVDPALWQEHSEKFVARCHEALLARPRSLAYLAGRGISVEQVVAFRLGIHLGLEKDGDEWLPDFRPWKAWGLKDEKGKGGRPRMLALPAGIVIPCFDLAGRVRRLRVRLAKPRPQDPRYQIVKGSCGDLLVAGALARVFVLVETELDAIMIHGQTGAQIGAIALGTASAFPDPRAAALLAGAAWVLAATDYDKAGGDPRVRARWAQMLPRSKRWPVSVGKDPGDMFTAGENLEAWVLAGLPPGLLRSLSGVAAPQGAQVSAEAATPREGAMPPAVAPSPVVAEAQEAISGDSDRQRPQVCGEVSAPQGGPNALFPAPPEILPDIRKLAGLMTEAGASLQVYEADGARGVNIACPSDFTVHAPEASRAMHDLVWLSEDVGVLLDRLSPGVYSASRVRAVAAGGDYGRR